RDEALGGRVSSLRDAKVLEDVLEQPVEGQRRVEDEGCRRHVVEAAEKGAQKRGLARPDLSGQQDEPDVVLDAVGELSQSVAMAPGQVEKLRVRRGAEGLLPEAVEIEVHRPYELPRESSETSCSLPCATK